MSNYGNHLNSTPFRHSQQTTDQQGEEIKAYQLTHIQDN